MGRLLSFRRRIVTQEVAHILTAPSGRVWHGGYTSDMADDNSQVDSFGKQAQVLAKNPLGIIALFIVLVYAMAALVTGLSGKEWQWWERVPLIWFLILFPCVVLAVFVFLVIKHHEKFYGPSDFKNEELFYRLMTPEERKSRIIEDLPDKLSPSTPSVPLPNVPVRGRAMLQGSSRLSAVGTETRSTRAASSGPQGDALAQALSSSAAYVALGEELVIRDLASEWKKPIQRQVRLGSDITRGREISLDGFIIEKGGFTAIEIRYASQTVLQGGPPRDEFVGRVRAFVEDLKHCRVTPFLVLAIVVDKRPDDAAWRELDERVIGVLETAGFHSAFRRYLLDDLMKKYGIA